MSEELKRCPFCGCEAACYGQNTPQYPEWRMCRVVCLGCEAHTCDHKTREEAKAAWNARTVPPPSIDDATVERVACQIDLAVPGVFRSVDHIAKYIRTAIEEGR